MFLKQSLVVWYSVLSKYEAVPVLAGALRVNQTSNCLVSSCCQNIEERTPIDCSFQVGKIGLWWPA